MTDLKCPYCREVRPSRSRLAVHAASSHPGVDRDKRRADVAMARTVENVRLVSAPQAPFTEAEWPELEDGLTQAGRELEALERKANQVQAQLERMDRDPSSVRSATLREVLYRLTHDGQAAAAVTVLKMLVDDLPEVPSENPEGGI